MSANIVHFRFASWVHRLSTAGTVSMEEHMTQHGRPSKCPKLYTTMISGENEFTPRKAWISSKLKFFKKDNNFSIIHLNTKY